MTASLIDLVRHGVTGGGIVDRAASALGIAPDAANKGLGAAGSAMLAGLASKATDTGALGNLVDLVKDPALESSAIDDPSRLLADDPESARVRGLGSRMMSMLFGARTDDLVGGLGAHAGLGKGTAASLLGLAAPLFMRTIGSLVRSGGLNAAGLGRMLLGQQRDIMAAVPGPMAGLFGSRPATAVPVEARAGERVVPARRPQEDRKRAWWILPAILIPLALLAVWLLRDRRSDEREAAERDLVSATRAPRAPGAATPTPAAILTTERLVETGVELRYAPGGVESRLLALLRDQSAVPDEQTWFDFDRLTFATSSARLEASSEEQLDNLAAILKAYPNASIKIGGYTDSTGSHERNLELSQGRADTVKQELVSRGIARDRLEAEGYAEAHPVASNDTEAGRAQNRRIALRVTAR